MRSARILHAVLFALAVPIGAAEPPCSDPNHRGFDFWLGEWNVYRPDGTLAGTNRIEREYGGCVVHERYDGAKGYRGESLNVWDASRGVWHQTWVDDQGLLLLLEGGIRDGAMVLEGRAPGPGGERLEHRITWTPNPDGSVRQHWESRAPGGPWSTAFDGTYRRR